MQHFTIDELSDSATAKAKGIDNTPTGEVKMNLQALIEQVLDPLRIKYGRTIKINSGYRSPALNKLAGGASTSQHLKGEAADITAGSREENKKLFELIKEAGVYDQLIDEKNYQWVHVSFRRDENNRKQILHL